MAELDTIEINNPSDSDFTHLYNGQPYTIGQGESKYYPKHLAFHLAHHLSKRMVYEDFKSKVPKKKLEEPNSRETAQLAQLTVFDSPARRIALYKILKGKEYIEPILQLYHVGAHIGDMAEFDEFVAKEAKKKESKE